MENIPYTPGLSPLRDTEIALEVAGKTVLQVVYVGSICVVVLLIGFLLADVLVRTYRKSHPAANPTDKNSDS